MHQSAQSLVAIVLGVAFAFPLAAGEPTSSSPSVSSSQRPVSPSDHLQVMHPDQIYDYEVWAAGFKMRIPLTPHRKHSNWRPSWKI